MGWEAAKLNSVISGGGHQARRFVKRKGTPGIRAE